MTSAPRSAAAKASGESAKDKRRRPKAAPAKTKEASERDDPGNRRAGNLDSIRCLFTAPFKFETYTPPGKYVHAPRYTIRLQGDHWVLREQWPVNLVDGKAALNPEYKDAPYLLVMLRGEDGFLYHAIVHIGKVST